MIVLSLRDVNFSYLYICLSDRSFEEGEIMYHCCLKLLWGAKRPLEIWLRGLSVSPDLHLTAVSSVKGENSACQD